MLSFEEITGPSDPDNPAPSRPDAGVDIPGPDGEGDDIEAIDGALTQLAALDPRQARIVEMRYFGGLTIEETAQALGISDATVKREWTAARAWLRRELTRGA